MKNNHQNQQITKKKTEAIFTRAVQIIIGCIIFTSGTKMDAEILSGMVMVCGLVAIVLAAVNLTAEVVKQKMDEK